MELEEKAGGSSQIETAVNAPSLDLARGERSVTACNELNYEIAIVNSCKYAAVTKENRAKTNHIIETPDMDLATVLYLRFRYQTRPSFLDNSQELILASSTALQAFQKSGLISKIKVVPPLQATNCQCSKSTFHVLDAVTCSPSKQHMVDKELVNLPSDIADAFNTHWLLNKNAPLLP